MKTLQILLVLSLSSILGLCVAQTNSQVANATREIKGAISTPTLDVSKRADANALTEPPSTAAPTSDAYHAAILTAPAKVKSLIKVDEKVGTGSEVTPGQYLEVDYTGWIYNPNAANRHGTKFDSSHDSGQPITFQLDARSVIRGWDVGLRGMKMGGKRTLVIPAYLAYGTKGSNSIPPNSTLIFDVELLGVK